MRQDYSGLFGKHTLKSPVELFIHEPTRFDIPVQCLHDEGVIGSRNKVTVMLHGSIFVSLKGRSKSVGAYLLTLQLVHV